MAFAMLFAAATTALLVAGLCFVLGRQKFYVVAPLQFIAALVVTSLVGPLTVSEVYADDALWLAFLISAVTPALFLVLRALIGRVDKPEPGRLVR